MVLLMDGVIYEEWTPASHDKLAHMVREHYREVFGEGSLYFDIRAKLKGGSVAGIPDGYCLAFDPDILWVIEVERSTPDPYPHIVNQLSRFINGLSDQQAQRELRDALWNNMDSDAKDRLRKRVGDIHPWLEPLILSPSLVVITEKATDEISRAVGTLRIQPKVLEFRTFCRRGVGMEVHIHEFETLAKAAPLPIELEPLRPGLESIVVQLQPAFQKYPLIPIRTEHRRLFPGFREPFILETDVGDIETWVVGAKNASRGDPDAGSYLRAGIPEWYKRHPRHPELRGGSKVQIRVVQPMRRYRLSFEP